MKQGTLAIAWLVAAGTGCMDTGDLDSIDRDDHQVLGGHYDNSMHFNIGICVGLGVLASCRAGYDDVPIVDWCSATLIAPNVALTSRRCIEMPVAGGPNDCSQQFSRVLKPTGIFATDDGGFGGRVHWSAPRSVHLPTGNNACTDDLAVLVLDRQMAPWAPGVIPLPTNVDLIRDVTVDPPSDVVLFGRGAFWERYNPLTKERVVHDPSGGRNIREHVPFRCAPAAAGDCTVGDEWSKPAIFSVPPGLFAYGQGTAELDVGGGVFDQDEFDAGGLSLIGMQTGRTMADDGTLNGGHAVRLDRHADLIRSVVQQAAAAAGYAPPAWAL